MKLSQKKQLEFDLTIKSLVGTNIEIISSNVLKQIGIKGVIVYDSANFLYLKIDETIKKFSKENLVIQFEKNSQKIQLNCNSIIGNLTTKIKKIK